MGCATLTFSHLRGQVVRAAWSFTILVPTLVDDVLVDVVTPVDPPATRIKIKVGEEGVPTVYVYGVDVAVIQDAVGSYHFDIDTSTATVDAEWFVRVEGSGTYQGAAEDSFNVPAGSFV